jgi:hypothetical protein
MAITKEISVSKVEVVGGWNIQVRSDIIIKEDNNEISRTYNRHVLVPFTSTKSSGTWVHTATDISGEDATVQAIANAVWTDSVKGDYKTWYEANNEA